MTRLLSLLFFLSPVAAMACSCIFTTTFCENIYASSNVAGVRIVTSYYDIQNGHFIDVEVLDEILGEAPSGLITFKTGIGISCDPDPQQFVVGDTLIVLVAGLLSNSLSFPCSESFTLVGDKANAVDYQEFIANIEDCASTDIFPWPGNLDDLFTIYPNPTSGDLNIHRAVSIALKATVYNASGALVAQFDIAGKEENPLDVSDWPRGLYFIRLETADDSVVKKFVKG